jgi:protein-tyrosine kinase
MSLVESALQRLRNIRKAEPDSRRSVPEESGESEPAAVARVCARIPAPVRWSTLAKPADFDLARLQAAGLYPPNNCTRRLIDEYRAIGREVVAASQQKIAPSGQSCGPIVVVTSAGPGDGKSYTAMNLALSIAGQNVYDVLLVDADCVKRTISAACNLGDRPGLAESLAEPRTDFLDHGYPTPIPRLRILPAGSRPSQIQDLFAPARVSALFDAMRNTMAEHIVIVDTPPILVSSDSSAVVDLAGQVLLVVRAGSSLEDAVRAALERIRKTVPVGVILNSWLPLLPSEKKTYASHGEYAR